MALSYPLDVQQAFSFTPGTQTGVGHLLSATFFGTALAADLTLTDPKTSASLPAAGALSQVQWGETAAAPISMTAYISAHNRTVLQPLLLQNITNLAVVISFRVEEYDPMARAYYVAFTPKQPPLNALIGKAGSAPELQIASSPVTVKTTQLYQVNFTVGPVPQMQGLTVAASASKVAVMQWGIL